MYGERGMGSRESLDRRGAKPGESRYGGLGPRGAPCCLTRRTKGTFGERMRRWVLCVTDSRAEEGEGERWVKGQHSKGIGGQ